MKKRDCANCKHHTEDGCSSWDCEFETKDLISRADAIAYIDRIINSGLGRNKSLDYIHKYISALPSADAVEGWRIGKPTEQGKYMVTIDSFGHKRIDLFYYGKPMMPNRKVRGKCWYRSDDEWGDVVYDNSGEIIKAYDMAIEALQEHKTPTIPMFAESAEAYKAWTGEEMGKTSDEINEMNNEIIKDILKMMPTAYLLEALGVSTFEELTEPTDKPHGRLIDADKLKKQLDTVYNEMANERERKGLRLARWFLISAPTVSADRPHGEWIKSPIKSDMWHCSVCGAPLMTDDINETHYCPNCGADMKGENNELQANR